MNKDKINILIVEDEIITIEYLKNILEQLGFENIFEASSADEAFNVFDSDKIDLVFMDININGALDGISLARQLNIRYDIPIIYITAYSDTQVIDEASHTNIYGYIIKPFYKANIEASLKILFKSLSNKKEEILDTNINLGKDLFFDKKKGVLYKEDSELKLAKRDLALLEILCVNVNEIVSYNILKSSIWMKDDISDSTIRDAISRLKRKTGLENIKNISGIGYILNN